MFNILPSNRNVCTAAIYLMQKGLFKEVTFKTSPEINLTFVLMEAVKPAQINQSEVLSLNEKKIVTIKLFDSGEIVLKVKGKTIPEDFDTLFRYVQLASKQLQKDDNEHSQDTEKDFLIELFNNEPTISDDVLIYALQKWSRLPPPLDDPLPLEWAIDLEQWEIAKTLIARGCNVNNIDSYGRSMLGNQLEDGSLEFAKELVNAGAFLSQIELEDDRLLEKIFFGKNRTCPCASWDSENNTLLLPEAPIGIQQYLVNRITKLEFVFNTIRDEEKSKIVKKLLHIACDLSSPDSIKKLITYLSQTEKEEWLQSEQLDSFMYKSSFTTIQTLIKSGMDKTRYLHLAVLTNRKDVVEYLIQEGADVSSSYNNIPLLESANAYNHSSITRLLLSKGTNPNRVTKIGTAATLSTSIECVQMTIKKEKRGLSEYTFCLKLIGHIFQLIHKLEDPIFEDFSLEGMAVPSLVSFKESFAINNYDKKKTCKIFSYPKELGSCFSRAIASKGGNDQKWLNSAIESISSIAEDEAVSSSELEERFNKGEGIPIYNNYKIDMSQEIHGTWMWFEGNVAVLCNSGQTKDKAQIIFVFLDDRSKITKEVIEKLRSNDCSFIEGGFLDELGLKKDSIIIPKQQKGGFCTIRSFLLLMEAIMMCKAMGPVENRDHLIVKSLKSKNLVTPLFRHGKAMLMDNLIEKILNLYEDEKFEFKRDITLLLKMLAKAPPTSAQTNRLITFIKKNNFQIDLKKEGPYLWSIVKSPKQLDWLYECLGKQKEKFDQTINSCNDQLTPLLYAIKEHRLTLIELLLKNKANPNQPDAFGKLPLQEALNKNAVSLLLQYGANPFIGINEGKSFIQDVVNFRDVDLLENLLENQKSENLPELAQQLLINFLKSCSVVDIFYKVIGEIEILTGEDCLSRVLTLIEAKKSRDIISTIDCLVRYGANLQVNEEHILSLELFELTRFFNNIDILKKIISAINNEGLLLNYLERLLLHYNDQHSPLIDLFAKKGVTIDLLSAKRGVNKFTLILLSGKDCLVFLKNGADPLFKTSKKTAKTTLMVAILLKKYTLVKPMLEIYPVTERKNILKKCHEMDGVEAEETDYDAILELCSQI